MAELNKKPTPTDVSEFEREQLRFFLDSSDPASVLAEINPSLAWLPLLAEMKAFQNDAVLPTWMTATIPSAVAADHTRSQSG